MRQLICLTTVLFFLISCKEKPAKELEPNNSFRQANKIELNKPVEGFFDSPSDRDYFIFDVTEELTLDISLTDVKGVNHSLYVFKMKAEPLLLKIADDNRKSSPERISNLYAGPGSYCVAVQHGDGDLPKENRENPYTLLIKSRGYTGEEREPNDGMESANEIQPGTEIRGFFSPALNRMNRSGENQYREEDWFFLNVESDKSQQKIMNISLSSVPGVNAVLSLYDPDGIEIMTADNNGPNMGESIKGAGMAKQGRYYIMVSSSTYGYNHDEPYILKASIGEYDPSFETEPNDETVTANPVNGSEIKGSISSIKDRDFFSYKGEGKPGIYRIELLPGDKSDLTFAVFDKKSRKLAEVNNGGAGEREAYPNIYIDGDFYISVQARSLPVDSTDHEYLLTIKNFDSLKYQELEPNDSMAEAGRISGDIIQGYISKKADRDYFLLEYDARIKNTLEITGPRGGEIRVSVTDPLGYIIKSVNVKSDSSAALTEIVDRKGFVIVETVMENFDNSYIINIKR